MHRLMTFYLTLSACGTAVPTTQTATAPQGQPDAIKVEDSGEPFTVTVRLGGSVKGGLLVREGNQDPVFLAPGAEVTVTRAFTLEGEPLLRLNQGGARVVSWGYDGCAAGESVCRVTPTASMTINVVLEELLYVGRFASTDNLYALSFDGADGRQVTPFTADGLVIDSPRLSPDGRSIVYVSNRALFGGDAIGPAKNLWIMPAHGGEATPLTRSVNADASEPCFVPDGSAVVYTLRMATRPVANLHVVQLKDGASRALTTFEHASTVQAAVSAQGIIALSNRSRDGKDVAEDAYLPWLVQGGSFVSDIPAWPGAAPVFDASGTRVAFVACDNLSCTQRSAASVSLDGSFAARIASLASVDDTAFAATSSAVHLLRASEVLTGEWPQAGNFTPMARTELGAETPVSLAAGQAGVFVLTESVDTSVPKSTWHLRGPLLDKELTPGTVRSLLLTR